MDVRANLLDRMNKLEELCCDDMDSVLRGGKMPSGGGQIVVGRPTFDRSSLGTAKPTIDID